MFHLSTRRGKKREGGGGENWGEIFEGSQTRITLVVDLSIGRVKTRWREKKSEIPTDGGRGVSIGRAINRARKTAQLLIVVGRPVCGMGIGHRSKIYSRFRIRVSTSFPPPLLNLLIPCCFPPGMILGLDETGESSRFPSNAVSFIYETS